MVPLVPVALVADKVVGAAIIAAFPGNGPFAVLGQRFPCVPRHDSERLGRSSTYDWDSS